MMQNKKRIYSWLIAVFLVLQGGSLSPVWAYAQVTPPSAWRTTPVMSEDVRPSYQFRSTSAFPTVSGRSTMAPVNAPAYASRPRRSTIDEEPDGEEVGVFAPVGEPFVLLLMAFIYFIWKKMSKKSKKMQKNLVMSKKSSTFAPAF